MRQMSTLSYEISLKVHTSPHISRHLRPNHPPFWIERRAISRVITPPYTFYEDPVRGTLVHARTGRNQVVPQNRGESGSLYPEKCTGIWFLPTPDLARQLQDVEADMLAAFARIQRVDHRQTPSIEDMTLAGYLRQLFDHFLNYLFKQFNRSYSPVSGGPGAFESPIPLESVEEPHMKNALKNKAAGQSYRVGAWTVGDSESHVGQVDGPSLAPLHRKRSREPERQPVAELLMNAASAQLAPTFSAHLLMPGPPNIDHTESDPKSTSNLRLG
ncbi:hypothetical protein FRC00_003510 [Tulasnella sp. 408]|nr:hypothetical protein FRC00_003510 [Tulasnella sp. 408]